MAAIGLADGSIVVVNFTEAPQVVHEIQAHSSYAYDLDWSQDSLNFVSISSRDNDLKVWDIQSGNVYVCVCVCVCISVYVFICTLYICAHVHFNFFNTKIFYSL